MAKVTTVPPTAIWLLHQKKRRSPWAGRADDVAVLLKLCKFQLHCHQILVVETAEFDRDGQVSKSCSRPCLISGKRCDMFTTSGNWSPMAEKVLPTVVVAERPQVAACEAIDMLGWNADTARTACGCLRGDRC